MTAEIPQYYKNNLEPVPVDRQGLRDALEDLRRAVVRGIRMVEANSMPPDPDDNHAFGPIYNGDLGIVIMALRLERQAKYLETHDQSAKSVISEVRKLASARVNLNIQKPALRPGRLSPIGSPSLGASLTRILAGISRLPSLTEGGHHRVHRRDIGALREAVEMALEQGDAGGGDEVLYGRAGLLFALLNLQSLAPRLDENTKDLLTPIFAVIPQLVDRIIHAGMRGARDYREAYGDRDALPLMWSWHEKFYVGAIHGVCGILAALLACGPEELASSYHVTIAETISALCKMCISHDGHLPSSLPHRTSSRRSPLVQICHGAPGLAILLSYARKNPNIANTYWQPEWDEALRLSTDRIWEQGLLSKGGGLCHGIAGNAWPFLMLHNDTEYGAAADGGHRKSGDVFLSHALTFLLQAQQTQPFNQPHLEDDAHYRTPDNPYSLFEGLAGTITAWAEACVVISARLREMQIDEGNGPEAYKRDREFREQISDELGFPGFSVRGFL